MSKHLDKYTTFRYISNQLTPEQETLVQEHVSECDKCREEIRKYRALTSGINAEQPQSPSVIKLIYKSTLFRVAASLIIVAGITFAIMNSRPEPLPIQGGHDSGTILSTDTYQPDTYQPDTYQPATQQADTTMANPDTANTTGIESDTLTTAPVYYSPEK
jgi:hypothetical protein